MSFLDLDDYALYPTSAINQNRIDYIEGTRLGIYALNSLSSLEIFSFDKINPNDCAQFLDSFSFKCS